jgi:hypothetical protein
MGDGAKAVGYYLGIPGRIGLALDGALWADYRRVDEQLSAPMKLQYD